jgi:plasmid stability protein
LTVATIELTNIDDHVYRALQARAAIDNRSISQEVEAILREFLAKRPYDPRKAAEAALELAGSWEDDRTAEEIIADIRNSRRSGHRESGLSDVFA